VNAPAAAPPARAPLAGVRVLDLSRILAGPYAAQILGDLGADVIKIEQPGKGDDTRHWGPPFWGDSAVYYLTANRNKRSRAIDFTTEAGRAALHELLADADVLIENYKTGGLARYGLDEPRLRARYPRLIYCSITGFGHTGPMAGEVGYDALVQAMGGLMSITGPDAATPTKVGVATTDITTGLYAVIAILAALRERDRSGLGQHCDLSLLDAQVSALANVAMSFMATGRVPHPMGNAHATIVPYQTFETQDLPLMLAVGNDAQFARLSERMGETWAKDARFATNPSRVANREALVGAIAARFREAPRAAWLERFAGAAFPFGPVNALDDLAREPQVVHRDLLTTMSDEATPCLRSPIRLSRTPITSYRAPPALDAHPDARFDADDDGEQGT
jgi:crotonobetainyl-CoA:carnitine CoA-transferase CaiB-like acyl-CoA transferase